MTRERLPGEDDQATLVEGFAFLLGAVLVVAAIAGLAYWRFTR